MMLKTFTIGVIAGFAASLAIAPLDRITERMVSDAQKRREKRVREASPHQIAGRVFGERLLKRELTEKEIRIAQLAFTSAYSMLWGTTYTAIRRRYPLTTKYAGLPFSVGFYMACDGMMAPLMRLSPPIHYVPWQPNAKEFLNHVAWTATAETVNRLAERYGAQEPLKATA